MSRDSYREITHQSWFGRVGSSVKGVVFGIILFIVAFPLLFWNEGRAVRRYKALTEGAGTVISIASDKVDAANGGKLVHITGHAATADILEDNEFGISVNAIRLKRITQMYQWKENSKAMRTKNVGGGTTTKTTYFYEKEWSDKLIRSSSFKESLGHTNPSSMTYESKQYNADDVTLGAFNLSQSLIRKIDKYEDVNIQESSSKLPSGLKNKAKIFDNSLYFGTDPESPQIGDIKISFKAVKPLDVSVVSKQTGKTFEPYITKGNQQIELLQNGIFNADSMFEIAIKENSVITWVIRFIGFGLMFLGSLLVFNPLSVVSDVIPFLGNIVGAGVFLAALFISMAFSLLTISIAWIIYRPVLGVLLLIVTGVLVFGLKLLPNRN
jgi:hypothetical protein